MKLTLRQLKRLITEQFINNQFVTNSIQRLIYSDKPFTSFRETQQDPVDLSGDVGPKKPNGLWYACGDQWARFISIEGYNESHYTHLYEININESEMLMIRTTEDFEGLEARYGRRGNAPQEWKNELHIDWPAIAQDYAGIEICPYQGSKRRASQWYYPWDVASGCIWSSRAIAGIKEIPLKFYKRGGW